MFHSDLHLGSSQNSGPIFVPLHMYYSLKTLKGEDCIGDYIGVIKRDAGSLDSGSS